MKTGADTLLHYFDNDDDDDDGDDDDNEMKVYGKA